MSEPPRFGSWLAGRSGRAEYWALIAILFALSFALSFLQTPPITNVGAAVVVAFVQARRLRDINRTGWWALAVTLAPAVLMLALMRPLGLEGAFFAASAFMLALIVLIGALPGTPGPNRFGPPARFTWLRLLRGY
jgi:uncharacterized membrane protein YhaH (DUF805 family)